MNTITVEAARWTEVARGLRDQDGFDFLNVITAVDWLKQDKIEVVYHLYSYGRREELCVKIDLPRAQPQVPSVAQIWRTAEWQEREQYDLVGVIFEGHPDLRRILLPEDWPGHPLRKDWTEPAAYNGMPTTRANTLDLLPKADKERPR